jgi:nitroimidazol reductase NimA-like FMN-containing flavoprotein (pyridoxamine 5'-phosphate oxidase superfamily)
MAGGYVGAGPMAGAMGQGPWPPAPATSQNAVMGDALNEPLDREECVRLLAQVPVGRMAIVEGRDPIMVPVNHRIVRAGDDVFVVVRTAPGSTLDRADGRAAFQVDGIDEYHRRGWSVLVRGTLHHLSARAVHAVAEQCRPEPWLVGDLDHWLVLEVDQVSGRRLVDAEQTWVFHVRGYL